MGVLVDSKIFSNLSVTFRPTLQKVNRELTFSVVVCVSYYNRDCGKTDEVVKWYAACDLTDRRPKQVEQLYRNRSAIETDY